MATLDVVNGPGKWDLALALFESDLPHFRSVRFTIMGPESELLAYREGKTPPEVRTGRRSISQMSFEINLLLVRRTNGADLSDQRYNLIGRINGTQLYFHCAYDLQMRRGSVEISAFPRGLLEHLCF